MLIINSCSQIFLFFFVEKYTHTQYYQKRCICGITNKRCNGAICKLLVNFDSIWILFFIFIEMIKELCGWFLKKRRLCPLKLFFLFFGKLQFYTIGKYNDNERKELIRKHLSCPKYIHTCCYIEKVARRKKRCAQQLFFYFLFFIFFFMKWQRLIWEKLTVGTIKATQLR